MRKKTNNNKITATRKSSAFIHRFVCISCDVLNQNSKNFFLTHMINELKRKFEDNQTYLSYTISIDYIFIIYVEVFFPLKKKLYIIGIIIKLESILMIF